MPEIFHVTTPQQVEQVRYLFGEYRAQLPVDYCFRSFDAEVAGLPGEYSPPGGMLLLATVVGQPVGCVALRPFPRANTCEMKRLYVRPTFRGDKLGRRLAERVIQEARDLGYSAMRLDSYGSLMQSAVGLYRKLGFREVGPEPLERVEGLVYMELEL